MKNNNELEVILFSKFSPGELQQTALVRWLGTTAQSAIRRQHKKAKKIFLKTLKDTSPIYMS